MGLDPPRRPGALSDAAACDPCAETSDAPIRYSTGEVVLGATDIATDGFGIPWGHRRTFSSRLSADVNMANGYNWLVREWSYADRVSTFLYDFRNRRTDTDGEVDFYEQVCYDNLDRILRTDRRNTTSAGNLILRSLVRYDDRGRVFQSVRYAVDPTTGTIGNSLTDNTWYDAAGNEIKSLPAGSSLFTKAVYDSLRRQTTQFTGYGTDANYAAVQVVTNNVILEQSESTYDAASNGIQATATCAQPAAQFSTDSYPTAEVGLAHCRNGTCDHSPAHS